MDKFIDKDYVLKQVDGGLNGGLSGGLKSLPGAILNYPDFKPVEFDRFRKHYQDKTYNLDFNFSEFEGIGNGEL